MSEITHSTLTSPRSPLFSDSDPPGTQSGSEIVTSDEEPDLGAFTTVLRAWGHLQPPLRIPPHFQSSSSSRTGPTPTTITGYPGFGGGDSETVEESTVWNRIPIQSYLNSYSRATRTSSTNRTERAAAVLEEADDSYFSSSPPPSPASEGARTVEIASETDAVSLHEFASYEDGASGERLVVQVATPPSIDAQTVSVASVLESHEEQTQPSPPVPPAFPTSYDPHVSVVNDISIQSISSASSISSQSISTQPLDDNTPISRSRPYSSALSIISYQPQISTTQAQSSVFQESPSPALVSDAPFQEVQTATSSSPTIPIAFSRSTMAGTVSGFSHAESDIINSYYAQRPSGSSSADQPALGSPWARRLELSAPPPNNSQLRPLIEQDSPSEHRLTPSVVDDNSSASAVPEDTPPPPSATTSIALSVLHEFVTVNSESSDVHSNHSLTPSHTFAFPATSATVTATRQPSLDSSTVLPLPPLSTTHREQQTRPRGQMAVYSAQPTSLQQRYHLLSQERDSDDDQPSLGYLDEALSFIASERARWTAAREAGLGRGSSPHRGDGVGERESIAGEEETRRYATEPRTKKRSKQQPNTGTIIPTMLESGLDSTSSSKPTPSLNGHTNGSNIVTLNSPKKKKSKSRPKQTLISRDIKPISILKRPDLNGASSSLLSNNAHTHATVGGSPSKSEHDGLATPRAHHYLYPWSSDNQDTIDDEEVDDKDDDEDGVKDKKWILRSDANRSYIHRRDSKGEGTSLAAHITLRHTMPKTSGGSGFDLGYENEEDRERESPRIHHDHSSIGSETFEREENGESGVDDGKGKGKEKAKRKKSRAKRKLPVTAPILISAPPSHSRSAPSLRLDAYTSANTDSAVDESHSSGPDMPALILGSSPSEVKRKRKAQKAIRPPLSPAGHATLLEPFGEAGYTQDKRARLITLAQHLQTLFPEEQAQLRKICSKLNGRLPAINGTTPSSSKKKKGKVFLDDCSFEYSSLGDSDLQRGRQEGDDPDPRGEGPGKGDAPVHVFIDHSNILFGLLSYLRRTSRKKKLPPTSKPVSIQPANGTGASIHTNLRPLPIPKTKAGIPIPETRPLIPLPSFATAYRDASLSCSAPSRSYTKDLMATRRMDPSSDGDGHDHFGYDEVDPLTFEVKGDRQNKSEEDLVKPSKGKIVKMRRTQQHMWHAALVLILERGRPTSRRVVAASRPLYQPMEDIERLGYEVKIFMRVPDFGDGADRLDKLTKYEQNRDAGSPQKKRESSPARAIGYGSLGRASGSRNRLDTPNKKSHVDQIFGNTSSDTGVTTSTSGPQTTRIKYREQGVDELLQLKLHQVIAATDNVPAGATIILATGDGNVGQFSEDGFLGPVRTALKRGWRVELYAWEDGLSRSWRREFGSSSEWGRKGMFRIIGMEQFSDYLVEVGDWQDPQASWT